VLKVADEDFAVADVPGARRRDDGGDGALDLRGGDRDLDLELGTKVTVYSAPR